MIKLYNENTKKITCQLRFIQPFLLKSKNCNIIFLDIIIGLKEN